MGKLSLLEPSSRVLHHGLGIITPPGGELCCVCVFIFFLFLFLFCHIGRNRDL